MYGGGYWPPEGAELCGVCGKLVHPGQCSGGILATDHRTITEPLSEPESEKPRLTAVPDDPPAGAPIPGKKRRRPA